MSEANHRKREGVVYSTRPDFDYDTGTTTDAVAPERQTLRVALDKKQRGGKVVTLVTGFVGPDDDLKELCRELKQACGVGGSAKEGEIVMQGDLRDKLTTLLTAKGHIVRKL